MEDARLASKARRAGAKHHAGRADGDVVRRPRCSCLPEQPGKMGPHRVLSFCCLAGAMVQSCLQSDQPTFRTVVIGSLRAQSDKLGDERAAKRVKSSVPSAQIWCHLVPHPRDWTIRCRRQAVRRAWPRSGGESGRRKVAGRIRVDRWRDLARRPRNHRPCSHERRGLALVEWKS